MKEYLKMYFLERIKNTICLQFENWKIYGFADKN